MSASQLLILARDVGGLLDAGEGAIGGREADCLSHGGLLSTDVLHKLGQSFQLTTARAAENSQLYLCVGHAVDDHLLSNLIPVGGVNVTPFLGALDCHVSSAIDFSHKSPDGLIRVSTISNI